MCGRRAVSAVYQLKSSLRSCLLLLKKLKKPKSLFIFFELLLGTVYRIVHTLSRDAGRLRDLSQRQIFVVITLAGLAHLVRKEIPVEIK